jgi:predicted TIM-barrel fold metal-dependent hydrolase
VSEAAVPASGWDCHVHVFDTSTPARSGHYQPVHRPLAQIEAQAATVGVGHLVLVQPSVYGSDNRVLLNALQQHPGRHRAVVVLSDDAAQWQADAWQALHAAGVRGARLNCVSPVGEGRAHLSARYASLAPLLVAQSWHLQWYATAEQLPQIAALHAGPAASTPVCVLDHLAGLRAGLPAQHPAWAALQSLADSGAWVKLSGWYLLGAVAPYAELMPVVARVAALFGRRLVWGSDWPHTHFAPDAMPAYASTWAPAVAALGAARAEQLFEAAAVLYR